MADPGWRDLLSSRNRSIEGPALMVCDQDRLTVSLFKYIYFIYLFKCWLKKRASSSKPNWFNIWRRLDEQNQVSVFNVECTFNGTKRVKTEKNWLKKIVDILYVFGGYRGEYHFSISLSMCPSVFLCWQTQPETELEYGNGRRAAPSLFIFQ